MKVRELAEHNENDTLMQLQAYAIWDKAIESLDHPRLLAHYQLLKQGVGRDQAIALMRELKGECMLRLMLGDIESCPILDFRPPINDLVGPTLLPFMQSLPFNARAAILVALSEDWPLNDVLQLQWQEVPLNVWSDLSRKVIDRVPPRLGCRYVFWEENTIGQPTPLLALSDLIHQELDVSWPEFARVASSLIRFEHFAHPEIEKLLGIDQSA